MAPWARGHGLARMLWRAAEDKARADGFEVINLDVRETQTAALQLCETMGYVQWGSHPRYAMVDGKPVVGRYYFKTADLIRRARSMILFPAIDLKDGQAVRLLRGDLDQATVFNDEPVEQALKFERQGFAWLHVVDLNGAVQGRSVNGGTVEAIAWSAELKIQLGGGIRTVADVNYWLDRGVERVVLGTIAVTDPEIVVEACKNFPDRVAVGIDGAAAASSQPTAGP